MAKAVSPSSVPKNRPESDSPSSISTFKSILDSSHDAICAFDNDRRLIAFNQAFAQIMQMQYGTVLAEGMIVSEIVSDEDRDFFADLGTRVLAGESFSVERVFEEPTGTKLTFEFRAQPLTAEGSIIGASVFARDVTQHLQNERELQMLFMQSPLPMWVLDVETLHFVRVNEAACLHYGYTEEEFRQMTPMDLRLPEDAERFEREVITLIQGEHDTTYQLTRHIKKNGEIIWVEIRSHILQQDRRILRLAHILDVTEKLAAERDLQEANKRFEFAAEATRSSVFEIDLRTGHVYRSKGLKSLIGFEPVEIPPTMDWWKERVHPDDRARAMHALMGGVSQGMIADCEYRMLHRDGHYITVWARGIILRDAHGTPSHVFGTTTDVSDEVLIKQELEASNRRFQLATKAVMATIYEYNVRTGLSTRSSGLTEMLGFTPDEIEPEVNWWFNQVHGDDLRRLMHTIDRSLKGTSDLYECEYRMRHKAGHFITVWDRGIIERDTEGRAIQIVGSAQDITRRRNVERELERANERFRLATDAVSAMIYDWDLKTGECYYSSGLEHLLGYQPGVDDEINEEGWYMSRVHPNDRPQLDSVLISARIEGHQYELEYRLLHRDGHYVYVWDRGIVIRAENGLAVRIVGSTQDITARKEIEAELIEERNRALTAKESADEMNRLKSNFFANMSHEIRTPMTAILGFAEVLKENLRNTSNERFVDIIEANSKRLLETINSVLDLARLESTRISLNPKVIDLNEETERIIAQLEPLASRRNLELQFYPSVQPPRALLDVRYYDQILTNLLSNAIKFTGEGKVTLRILREDDLERELTKLPGYFQFHSSNTPLDDHYSIVVEDTGIGIARDKIGLIFDEFRQASGGYNRNFEGAGLGLTISSRLAHAMGGSIEVRSAKGIGSQFILRLPVNLKESVEEEVRTDVPQPTVTHKPTILLVEDITSMAEMTEAMIGKRATFLHASSTAEARSVLESVTPDLILMDINLGEEMTGLDFTRELKARGLGQYARIVALTAYAMPKDRQMALDAGCDDYLAKPFSKAVLLETIEKNLEKRFESLSSRVIA